MPAKKYNFEMLKLEFFESPHLEVSSFFREKIGKFNGTMMKKTTGWTKDKKAWQERIIAQALEDKTKKKANDLNQALDNIRAYFQIKVGTEDQLIKLSVRDAQRVWEVLRTENNLPVKITKTENKNINLEEEDQAYNNLKDYDGKNQNEIAERAQSDLEGSGN